MRAQAHGCDFDMAALSEHYKKNPFEWIAVDGQAWSIHVFAMWTWQLRGCERRELVRVAIHFPRKPGRPWAPIFLKSNIYKYTGTFSILFAGAMKAGLTVQRVICTYKGASLAV